MRLLVVDDSELARRSVQRAVEGLGHGCMLAEDGAQAWDLFQKNEVDAIISDWVMPNMDGVQLCEHVRSAHEKIYTYFILLTSLGDKSHVLKAMESGVDDYLVKPLDPEDLQARLINAARMRALHVKLADNQANLERLNKILYEDA